MTNVWLLVTGFLHIFQNVMAFLWFKASSSKYQHFNRSLAVGTQHCWAITLPTHSTDEVRSGILICVVHIRRTKSMPSYRLTDFLQNKILELPVNFLNSIDNQMITIFLHWPCDKQTLHLFRCHRKYIHGLLRDPQNSSHLCGLYRYGPINITQKRILLKLSNDIVHKEEDLSFEWEQIVLL